MDRRYRALILALFALSGAAGLIYEACWSRQFGTLFGFTEQAMVVAVAAYFLGSAMGAWGAARLVAKVKSPLRGYAIAELVAGAWSLLLPAFFESLEGASLDLSVAAQLAVAVILVLPVTVALGASLPLMAEFLAREEEGAALVPRAYALNLVGALLGLLGASFGGFLLLGVRGTHMVGSVFSIVSGVGAMMVLVRMPRSAGSPSAPQAPTTKLVLPGKAYGIAALSGFGVLALQGVYLRLFSRALHNSSYSFAVVLAVFLLGLAWGSARAGSMVRRLDPLRVVGASAAMGAVLVPASLLLFTAVTHLGQLDPGGGFIRYLLIVAFLAAVVILPAVVTLGTVLPALWMHLESLGLGVAVGRLAAVNTLAAAVGAVVAGFVLLPILGLWGSATVVAFCVWSVAGLVAEHVWSPPGKRLGAVTVALVLVCAFGLASPDTRLRQGESLEAQWETPYGLVEVVRNEDNLMLRQDIHYLMGDTRNAQASKNQGHHPLYLHPAPEHVVFFGLATGITAGSALEHQEVKQVVVVEIIPEILEAARYFDDHNRYLLDDARARVEIADASRYLRNNAQAVYDVVISDLFVPWHSRTGYLYTVEHFAAVKARLKPGGIFAVWISLREVGSREFRLIADSLNSVFPVVSVWRDKAHPRKICLLAGTRSPVVDPVVIGQRIALIHGGQPEESKGFARWEDLESSFVGLWSGPGSEFLNTRDRPRVEHWAPMTERSDQRHGEGWLDELHKELFQSLSRPSLHGKPSTHRKDGDAD